MRTVCIGDIHGCLELLEQLLEKIKYDPAEDHLVFVGDLIDRGPDPAGVVRFVRALQLRGRVTVIRGNHEDKCIRWLAAEARAKKGGRENKVHNRGGSVRQAQWHELTEEEVKWLGELPIFVKVLPDWYAVHAGFEDIPMSEQKADRVIRVRWLDPITGEHKGMDQDSDNPFDKPAGAVFWMDRWKGPENIVYGHVVHSRATPRVDRPHEGVETWGIDTGACFGGALTALVLETREVIQVRDGKAYDRLYVEMRDGS
jgi:hypothetical protein